ncbi:Protein of unknown function [Pyronema omphalodes CBS 100304]|uniref:Uncharacterized protein n=1 Tax=Pyronema omphalodes (strain CBS 100304) TaxID=1076935 RepID=U4LK27_PYROM|nr:Protein of unknown function [Pyronema omphalodes CBS 100304]
MVHYPFIGKSSLTR